ncbi:unnamed protein product [Rhizoctonia solani]|uniref:N-acetyltransferase domain-containing protein n=1 Tax=Rhizoctonia solani TaxID=456999 RepID=A0A8H3AYZ1_9AGAM|nr:unnamed protein product [Rhizoctonia solani]
MDTFNGINYRPYAGETDLPAIMALVQDGLSEPYVIYTYRYFLSSWPHLAFMAHNPESGVPIGAIVCKQDSHRGKAERGYIAMLVVESAWRKRGIARHLVELSIEAMAANGADEVSPCDSLKADYSIPASRWHLRQNLTMLLHWRCIRH